MRDKLRRWFWYGCAGVSIAVATYAASKINQIYVQSECRSVVREEVGPVLIQLKQALDDLNMPVDTD